MKLFRKIKINKITPIKFTDKEKEIIELIKYWTDGLVGLNYTDDKYQTFYYNHDKIFIVAENNNYKARIRYKGFIEILLNKHHLTKKQVMDLMEDMLTNLKIKYQNIVDMDNFYEKYSEEIYNEFTKKA